MEPSTEPDLYDPILVLPDGANTVLEASQLAAGKVVTVVGQLVYRYGNYDAATTAILEDVIDGKIYALQVYNALSEFQIGDVVKLTGTTSVYGGVPQLQTLTAKEVVTNAADTQVIKAQEFSSISELKTAKDTLLSEWVMIKDVILGSYNNNGSTDVKDASGNSIPIYRAASYPSGVVAGDQVDLFACVSKFNTTDQLRVGLSSDYVVKNDTKAPVITMPTFENAQVGKDYKVSITITDNVTVTEAEISYTVNHTTNKISMVKNTDISSLWEASLPGSTFTLDATSISLVITAKDGAGNVASSEEVNIYLVDEPMILNVTPAYGAYTGEEKRPVIAVTAMNLGTRPTATLTLKDKESIVLDADSMSLEEGVFIYKPLEDLPDQQYTAIVTLTREDGKSVSYEWLFTVGTPEYSLYFGQLHSHTTYSDGSGSLDSALSYINNLNESDHIDFVAFTDHSNYFDTKTEVNPEAALYNKSLMTSQSLRLWDEYKNKIANFNASAENKGVIALAGFEMTWSGGPGHMNTWNTQGIVSRNNASLNSKTSDAGLKAYYDLLSQPEGKDSISQFNHPGTTFGTFSDFAYWNPEIDSRITLVEVGNGEGAIGSGGYFPSYSYYTMALDKGWHVAPSNNQDNHKGKWGNANDARNVILTDNLTEQGIYDALKDRKVYATEDKNLEITYTVNDEFMGTIIQEVPESLNIEVGLSDMDDAIQKAEIIVNSGRVVHTWEVNAQSQSLSVTLTPEYSYYYIRVTQKDGDLAVTAPVWVGSAKLLGISNVESSTSTPVTGEKLTIKTSLFNSEASDAEIKSLTYKLDGAVIGEITGGKVAKGSTQVIDYEYTPTKAKVQTITVDAVLTIGDKEYSFTKSINLDVRDVNKLVFIGIDGSHYNEYVAGNYKDSMSNFSSLAAQYNVRCVILKSSEELIAAAQNANGKYKMLILTAPSRRNGTALREPYALYTDSEIAAIKAFSKAGGSLVVCGWSDLYENYKEFPADDHMAAQQNKILEAVGATLRISDDGAYDDVLNAGGSEANKARLYLTTYNWDNALTKGIVYDENNPHDNRYSQLFSQYGGSTIYAVDQEGKPVAVLPAQVSPLVYGHSSTYSKDCDKDGIGGSIPKYEYKAGDFRHMILACEIVTHDNNTQSLVLVDGAAFMSNFEIQATVSDTNAELNYSNYNILQNLIQYVNPTKIDSIAEVHKEVEEGVKFTIEGLVTSNASGYDKNTAFFDCIYLQDETAGINAFPVSGDYKIGQKIRITGTTSSYQGERQLLVSSITLVDSDIQSVIPNEVSAKQINDNVFLGSLVKITGKLVKIEYANGAVQTILVQDAAGETARIFIDGYITTSKEIPNLAVGNSITAVGLSSYDNTFDGLAARIRIRDRSDIICTQISKPTPTPEPVEATPTPTSTPKEILVVAQKPELTVVNKKVKVKVEISEKTLKDVAFSGNSKAKIILGKEILSELILRNDVQNDIVIDLIIPTVEGVTVSAIVMDANALLLAKTLGQNITIHINYADSNHYTVIIRPSELNKVTADTIECNLLVSLKKESLSANVTGVLSIGTRGALPIGLVVSVPIENTLSLKAGKKVYIYRKNDKTGKLEEIPNNIKTIAKNGTLTLSSLMGGEFVICTKKVNDALPLVDKVLISGKSSLTVGSKLKVNVNLPMELVQVDKYGYGDPVGQEEVKISYKVSNKNIATISKDGTITGLKKGTVKITVTVTLENGQKKSFRKTITVK